MESVWFFENGGGITFSNPAYVNDDVIEYEVDQWLSRLRQNKSAARNLDRLEKAISMGATVWMELRRTAESLPDHPHQPGPFAIYDFVIRFPTASTAVEWKLKYGN